MAANPGNVFDKYFDVEKGDISTLVLTKSMDEKHCYLQDKTDYYGGFIVSNKPQVETRCKLLFIKSKTSGKFKPLLEFRKTTKNSETKTTEKKDVIISIKETNELQNFWKIIGFLQGFNELIETGEFSKYYQAVSHDAYKSFFEKKEKGEKMKVILGLIDSTDLDEDNLKSILYNQRKRVVKGFYYLLKNIEHSSQKSIDLYRNKHEIKGVGEESIWHHFLKNNSWILGLNTDLRFIHDLLSEQKIGREDSKAKGSSKTDLLGLSYFTTLIELKTPSTQIFKENKTSKSRANTFDFSNDFIEAYSQILAQHWDISSNPSKPIRNDANNLIDREIIRTIDPKAILIIGCRNNEFHHDRATDNLLKTDSFEKIRRDSKKVDIITYDELFERAFHIVSTESLPLEWYGIKEEEFIETYF